tara:strand:+ start:3843 stop:7688 length:3846 start_codon:yes stop_codon:yes gene_type:complete
MTRDERVKAKRQPQDVYLPGPGIGLRHLTLLPVWDSDCWRLQSSSETLATVNGVPIQNYTLRTKKNKTKYPQAIHLTQSQVNHVEINGLHFDIWVMNNVQSLYASHEFMPAPLQGVIQDVANRSEDWARDRYLMKEQLSTKSHRVLERFTGETQTAKLFREEDGGQQQRDQEFLMFGKKEVELSIVRYRQAVDVNAIPAVITTTHVGFVTYGAVREDILKSHPGVRFAIAGKMARRLFSALAFLHYHGIVHGNVSSDSVLLHLVGNNVEDVLLVDYTTARPFTPGALVPQNDLIADGEAAMKLIEDCCDLWALRNGPTPDADGEYRMEQATKKAMEDYHAVQRCATDYFERKGNPKSTDKGKKLSKLLEKTGYAWQSARANQEHNLRRRQINLVTKSKLEEMKSEWSKTHEQPRIGKEQYMLLSLGHAYLDSLADPLYFKRWDIMPHQICAKIKEHGGDLEHPWQTFQVKTTFSLQHTDASIDEQDLIAWLALCAEVHPEWRKALEALCARNFHTRGVAITRKEVHDLYTNLQDLGQLPASMVVMFEWMRDLDNMPNQVEETYQVWYHIPSRMFNLTQLQRLATPERLSMAINEGNIRCDNFVEVRGEPKIQGNYAPLSLLADFTQELGLVLAEVPNLTQALPTFDPSDFSQISQGRIVLARPGMLGYGSMVRSGDQCNYLNPKNPKKFETPSGFILTNFGDMKVLPEQPAGARSYDRPVHWSSFKTAEEIEAAADLSKRNILPVKAPSALLVRPPGSRAPSFALSPIMEVDESLLGEILKERERIRALARPPTKRNTDAISSKPSTPSLKRARASGSNAASPRPGGQVPDVSVSFIQRMEEQMQLPPKAGRPGSGHPTLPTTPPHGLADHLTSSFMKRNSALLSSPPRDPTNFNQSFTVADDTETLDEDWVKVNGMLKHVSADDNNDEPPLQGMFGFRVHRDDDDDEDEDEVEGTEVDPNSFARNPNSFASTSSSSFGKGKGTALAASLNKPSTLSMTKTFTSRFAQQHRPSSRSFVGASPSHGIPTAPFEHRRNKLSNVSNTSDDLPPTQPSSPAPNVQAATSSGFFGTPSSAIFGGIGGFGSANAPNAFSSPTSNMQFNPPSFGRGQLGAMPGAIFGSSGFGASSSAMPATRPSSFAAEPRGDRAGTSPTPDWSFGSTCTGTEPNAGFNSFSGKPRDSFDVNTSPRPKTPTRNRFERIFTGTPGGSFGAHTPATRPNSFFNNPTGSFGGSEYPETEPGTPNPRTGSPSIAGLSQDEATHPGAQSQQQDEDMPDTDVET